MKHCSQCNNFFSDDSDVCPNDSSALAIFDILSLIGKTIDNKYKVESLLGRGGMGAVFAARHAFIGNEVAVKVINPEMAMDRSIAERFLREARAAATIDHPNAIRVSDFGRAGDMLYLVMEFIQGESMKELLQRRHTISANETTKILSQVCAALDVAHSHQIVHRDLKPDNIMLKLDAKNEYIIKVVDFGIAKVKSAEPTDAALTSLGTIIGTASYMSPEQCQGIPTDHRSDIYSLGVIAYEALCGECPFTASIPMQLIVKHIIEPPPPLRSKNPAVAENIERIVMKALEKQPGNRYNTAGEFAQELSSAAGAVCEVEIRPATFAERRASMRSETIVGGAAGGTMVAPISTPSNAPRPAPPSPSMAGGGTMIAPISAPMANVGGTMIAPIQAPNISPPAASAPPADGRTVVGVAAPNVGQQLGRKPKLLVVINSKALIMLMKHQLQQAGYDVIAQTESAEANLTILNERPDLIILGVELPQLSGPELCTMIKTKPSMAAVAHTPILLFSSQSEADLAQRVQECGANGYIHKNWTPDIVVNRLAQHLKG